MPRFWITAVIWTVVMLVSRFFGGDPVQQVQSDPYFAREISHNLIPQISWLWYPLGLGLIYVLTGINVIYEWMRRPIMYFGRLVRIAGPGFTWVDPAFHQQLEDVPVQDVVWPLGVEGVQTSDNVPIAFRLLLTLRVVDVKKYVVEVEDGDEAVQQRGIVSATEVVRSTDLDQILHGGEVLFAKIRELLQGKIEPWGVQVKAVEIQDLRITDDDISQAIALKARAKKEGEAELVRAEVQRQVAQALNEAAEVLTDEGWQLKDREVLLEMARSAENNTILLPTRLAELLQPVARAMAGGAASTGATTAA